MARSPRPRLHPHPPRPPLQVLMVARRNTRKYLFCSFCFVWFGLVWFGLVWFGLVWFGLVWSGLVHIILFDDQKMSSPKVGGKVDISAKGPHIGGVTKMEIDTPKVDTGVHMKTGGSKKFDAGGVSANIHTPSFQTSGSSTSPHVKVSPSASPQLPRSEISSPTLPKAEVNVKSPGKSNLNLKTSGSAISMPKPEHTANVGVKVDVGGGAKSKGLDLGGHVDVHLNSPILPSGKGKKKGGKSSSSSSSSSSSDGGKKKKKGLKLESDVNFHVPTAPKVEANINVPRQQSNVGANIKLDKPHADASVKLEGGDNARATFGFSSPAVTAPPVHAHMAPSPNSPSLHSPAPPKANVHVSVPHFGGKAKSGKSSSSSSDSEDSKGKKGGAHLKMDVGFKAPHVHVSKDVKVGGKVYTSRYIIYSFSFICFLFDHHLLSRANDYAGGSERFR